LREARALRILLFAFRGQTHIFLTMSKFRRYLMSLILSVAMAFTAFGAATASANLPCTGMKPGMAQMNMTSKSDPCLPKASDCMDMSGCILAAAKLADPLELQRPGFWSIESYAVSSAAIPASADFRPDHSPPKRIA
jgi:hypothetical protein